MTMKRSPQGSTVMLSAKKSKQVEILPNVLQHVRLIKNAREVNVLRKMQQNQHHQTQSQNQAIAVLSRKQDSKELLQLMEKHAARFDNAFLDVQHQNSV